jgi:hypothetical protein
MKTIKNLALLLVASMFALSISAQSGSTGSSGPKSTKATTTTTTTTSSTTTKSNDKVDPSQKGPHGETVYIGPKNGKYYLDKTGKKIYLKK